MKYMGAMSQNPLVGHFQLGSVKLKANELIAFTEGYRYAEAYWRRFASDDPFEQPDLIYALVVLAIIEDPSPSKGALQGFCAGLEERIRKLMCVEASPKTKPYESLQ